MASKLQTTIKLKMKNKSGEFEKKQFTSVEDIPGSFLDDAIDATLDVEEALTSGDRKAIRPALRKRYELIADVLFGGQFTADEYLNGMDAREIMDITNKLLNSVISGPQNVYVEEKKK